MSWTRQFGTDSDDRAFAVATDATGVYVAGSTEGTFPGQSRTVYSDAFVRKYDADGNELWTRQFGKGLYDGASFVATDATGVYIAGSTLVSLSVSEQGSDIYLDPFVCKYDADGNQLWARWFGTDDRSIMTSVVAIDATGVYMTGGTFGTLPEQSSAGVYDAFIRKFDADGNELWTRWFGTDCYDNASAGAIDATGVYVAGSTEGTSLGQGNAGGEDAFVRKYDADGNQLWTRQFGTDSYDHADAIATDATGVYVAGDTFGTLSEQSSAGLYDAFARKYDADGNELWTSQFGTDCYDNASAVAIDATGVYVAGYTFGVFPEQGSAGGNMDAFIMKLLK